jgi:SNF2 family DNA or RNA helicase
MRTGKTLIALVTAEHMHATRVLFVTKKKAIESIKRDYGSFDFHFSLIVCNYERIHLVDGRFDVVIIDEAHSLGAFPKPSLRTCQLRAIVGRLPLILLSGTPSPESYSQLYHQFWVSERSPFIKWPNFYLWARDFVDVKHRIINGLYVNDYRSADQKSITGLTNDYFLTFSQEQAGFCQNINESILTVPLIPSTTALIRQLFKDRVVTIGDGELVVADTAVKLQSKIHQLCSGTIITESGRGVVVDHSKALYIKSIKAGRKIAIFYKYKCELELLRTYFTVTDSPEEFNMDSDRTFVCQIQAGAMGVDLSSADVIIFFNIDFSSVCYWQARARMQSQSRTKPCIVEWIFSEGGIEEKIYRAVINKNSYTTSYFLNDYGKAYSKKNHRIPA